MILDAACKCMISVSVSVLVSVSVVEWLQGWQTRWSTTLPSIVNLPHANNFGADCGAHLSRLLHHHFLLLDGSRRLPDSGPLMACPLEPVHLSRHKCHSHCQSHQIKWHLCTVSGLLLCPSLTGLRCRANMAHIRQSRECSSLGFQVKVLKIFVPVPAPLGSGQSIFSGDSPANQVRRKLQSSNSVSVCRGTSLKRNCPPLGPYSRTVARASWWS
jgi:hypothetical protein